VGGEGGKVWAKEGRPDQFLFHTLLQRKTTREGGRMMNEFLRDWRTRTKVTEHTLSGGNRWSKKGTGNFQMEREK